MAGALRVAVVGVGQRGLQHVESIAKLQADEEVQLVALADPFEENLAEAKVQSIATSYKQGSTQLFTNVDEMIDTAKPDAVWFVMPPNQHRGEIERTVAKGVAIFAEKPQSLFYDEIKSQADAIDKAGVPSIVGFQKRYDPWYTAIHDYMADKQLASAMAVSLSSVEGHSAKHTPTERQGGPANRVWTANRAWSGTSMVEAGIHQTDQIRYWVSDDVKWVQAAYVERPEDLQESQGDNPTAYTVVYGFKRGGIANVIFTKPARSYFNDKYEYVHTPDAHIAFEDDLVVYSYQGADYPPASRPTREQLRTVLAAGPESNPMGSESTLDISRQFARSITESDPSLRRNSFRSSMNSLAAVLAANVSDSLGGIRIDIDEFENSDKFAEYRQRPEGL
ncbi:MAG: Gfo/Idh/MocA family oxidoreductase [Chloroflexi bacterium]|nr:Gfo/Idh/MocA family oxidoreductase [Chloroflexota bacterium]